MNQQTQPPTETQATQHSQQVINTNVSANTQAQEPSTNATSTEPPAPTVPFSVYQHHLVEATNQPVQWIWPERIPLGGIVPLDGDYGTNKSLLALHIAAHVSSGTPLPDGTPILRGGVVIVTPHVDATTLQIPFLSTMPANLLNIEILSYVYDPATASHPSGYRPFSLPQDLPRLFEAIDRVNARLIILDPFIELLENSRRWTDRRLADLLAHLNQQLIARNITALLIRSCPAKGGHAKPSILERSPRFHNLATSHLLIAPDPIQPDRLLLAHVKNKFAPLAPTLILQTQWSTSSPKTPSIAFHGTHQLLAKNFLDHRPDTLHRQLLFDHLLQLIKASPNPTHVSSLYAQSPHSSPSQVQHTLKDLLNMGQIEQPARGFYSPTPANPVFRPKGTPGTPLTFEEQEAEHERRALETVARMKEEERQTLARLDASSSDKPRISRAMFHLARAMEADEELQALFAEKKRREAQAEEEERTRLAEEEQRALKAQEEMPARLASTSADQVSVSAATTSSSQPLSELNESAATTPHSQPLSELNESTETPSYSQPIPELNESAATNQNSQSLNQSVTTNALPHLTDPLNQPAATTPTPPIRNVLDPTGQAYEQMLERNWRVTHLDNPFPTSYESEMRAHAAYQRYKASLNPHPTP
jgi:hypothetical protein